MSNVTVIKETYMPPEGAPPSEWPIAEQMLASFPKVREHFAERDVLAALENVPVIITIAARAGWAALAQDISDATESGRLLLADWWRHAWTETFQRPAFWSAPTTEPDPGAHPYPEPAPVAEPEPELTAAALEPLPGLKSPELPIVPAAEPEPAAGEPALTDATAVLVDIAREQVAAKEPAAPEATTVMPVTEAPAEAVAVAETDGGESDE